jgi:uncharacterized RDD family membrane protein YckC
MGSVAVNTSLNVNIDFELAGIDKRILAWLIDFAIRILYIYFAVKLFTVSFHDELIQMMWTLALLLPVMFYYLLFELLMNGQSPGKKIFNIKVVSLNGYKPTYIQYLNRWIFRLMDTGFITIFFFGMFGDWIYGMIFLLANLASIIYLINSKKEQRIGDVISNTVVIRLNSSVKISDTIFTEIEDVNYQVKYPNVVKLSDRDISIIQNALRNAERTHRYETLWNIVDKLQPVINAPVGDDPYYFLHVLIRDYNYLTTK